MGRRNHWRGLAILGLVLCCCSASAGAQDADPAGEPDPRHRTGHYEIELPGIPYRVIYETRLRYGWEPRSDATDTYRRTPDQPTNDGNRTTTDWFVEVPDSYRADRPAGLIILVQSGLRRRCPELWREALTTHNLIWVGFPAGLTSKPWFAHARSILAVQLMAERYALDPRRIYVIGLDNGTKAANAMAVLTPEHFRAAWMIYGGAFPADLDYRGDLIEGFAPDADRRALRNAARNATLVYFNGEDDIERDLMLLPAAAYDRAGFNVTVIDEPTHGTDDVPGPEHLAAAIDAFERPLHRDAERDYQRAIRMVERGKRGEALPLLLDTLSIGSTADFAGDARGKLTELQDAYAAEIAAVEAHITAEAFDEASQGISVLLRGWGDHGEQDAERLTESLREARRAARGRE